MEGGPDLPAGCRDTAFDGTFGVACPGEEPSEGIPGKDARSTAIRTGVRTWNGCEGRRH